MSKKTFEKAAIMPVIGNEPEADLSAFYQSPEDPALKADIDQYRKAIEKFEVTYKGKLKDLSALELAKAIEEIDADSELGAKISSYGQLLTAKHSVVYGAFGEKLNDTLTDIENHLAFFNIEANAIEDKAFEAMMKQEPRLARYESYIHALRQFKPYQLSEAEEKLSAIKNVTGANAWIKLFDEILPNIKFEMDGQPIKMKDVQNLMSESSDRAVREKAYRSFAAGIKSQGHILTYITNILALDKAKSDETRKFPKATSSRNLGNRIEDETVDTMNDSIVANYARTSHRYYELKRQAMGLSKLAAYDRNAPWEKVEQSLISFDEAKVIVLEAYRAFSPEMADIAESFFTNNWIDARATDGKDTGAFSHPTSNACHPVIYMNWTGTKSDVSTLAHELGHGVHQVLAAKGQQSEILSGTPLTLAETASIFGEQLVFQHMLARETNPSVKRAMLSEKIEDMLNSVVRQIAFFNFEKLVHEERRSTGERLSEDRLGEIWMQVQRDSLGPAFEFDDDYKSFWSYIPHFIHSPFYVYAYACGDTLVNALYNVYQDSADKETFKTAYMDLLKAGGSRHHSQALKPFGIDLKDRAFWDNGAKVFEDMVTRLEQTMAEEQALKPTLTSSPTPA